MAQKRSGTYTDDIEYEEDITKEHSNANDLDRETNKTEIHTTMTISQITDHDNELLETKNSPNERENEDKELGTIVKTRRRKGCPDQWNDNTNKKRREQGKMYVGWTKEGNKRKRGGPNKAERRIGPICDSKLCSKSKVRKCTTLSSDHREQLFKLFWNMSWTDKKMYVLSLVKKCPRKRSTKEDGQKSRRSATLAYTIKLPGTQDTLSVCKKTFLSTFGLKEWTVLNWLQKIEGFNDHIPNNESSTRRTYEDQHSAQAILSQFLDNIPKLPSHNCRKSTEKVYIEPIFGNNVSSLYEEFVRQYEEKNPGSKVMSHFTFEKIVNEKNIGFQLPKKGRSDCIAYESENLDAETYNAHIKSEEAVRTEKEADEEESGKGEYIVLTQDVQSVKDVSFQNIDVRDINTEVICNPTTKPSHNQDLDGASTDKDESTTTPSMSRHKKSRFYDTSAPDQRNQSRADKAYDLMMKISEKRCSRDESSAYGNHIAAKHRKYTQHTKSVVEHLIGEILFKADMGLYEKEFTAPHSQPQNSFCNPYNQLNTGNTNNWRQTLLPQTCTYQSPSPSTASQSSDAELHRNN